MLDSGQAAPKKQAGLDQMLAPGTSNPAAGEPLQAQPAASPSDDSAADSQPSKPQAPNKAADSDLLDTMLKP
jgi:hypothetical protein